MSFLQHLKDLSESAKHNLDFANLGVMAAHVLSLVPDMATLLPAVWFSIRIYETRTVQRLLGKPDPKERSDD